MDPSFLNHRLDAHEHQKFERDGFLMIPDALPHEMVRRLTSFVDHHYEQAFNSGVAKPGAPYEKVDIIGLDPMLLDLLDWTPTFAKVVHVLGWNISLFHSHLNVTPSAAAAGEQDFLWSWHQDNGQLNIDLQLKPLPRVSLKLAFYLSDTSEPGRGNTYVVPGSHCTRDKPNAVAEDFLLEGAFPICCQPGSALLIDQRIWHSASPNTSPLVRKVVFLSYGFRWLQPMDRMEVEPLAVDDDPIRQQLLNTSVSYHGGISNRYWPVNEDVPLQRWTREFFPSEPR